MRKQFSYSMFIFMLTVGLVITVERNAIENLTARSIATTLIAYSVLQTSIWMKFLNQYRVLKKRLK